MCLYVQTVPYVQQHTLVVTSCCLHVLQKEFALPEQFKTTWNGSTMVTVQTDSV